MLDDTGICTVGSLPLITEQFYGKEMVDFGGKPALNSQSKSFGCVHEGQLGGATNVERCDEVYLPRFRTFPAAIRAVLCFVRLRAAPDKISLVLSGVIACWFQRKAEYNLRVPRPSQGVALRLPNWLRLSLHPPDAGRDRSAADDHAGHGPGLPEAVKRSQRFPI